jgi:hypothetical protein
MIWRLPKLRNTAVLLLAILAVGVACTPTHVVKPLPNFVEVAIQPGDTVIVTTHSRETVEFVVTEVSDRALHGAEQQIEFIDIAELRKVAWERPPSPCGGDEALGCSVPLLVSLASEEHSHYRETFYSACETHDYCYRHGSRTYGLDREYCDAEFLQNMRMTCPMSSDSTFGTIFEVLNDSVDSRFTCLRIAADFHLAASDFGEKHFQTQSGSYCEYNGPP